MVKNTSSIVLGALATVLTSGPALAHIRMDAPIARNVWAAQPGGDPIKIGPCGGGEDDLRTEDPDKINVFSPGETITVSWYETVDHPAHYRISIDMDGQDDFPEKSGPDDIVDPPVLPVLLDGIPDAAGGPGTYSVEVTLPNETCDNCTLQLIQYMTDRNEPYYVCADLRIEGETGDETGSGGAATTDPSGAGGAMETDSTSTTGDSDTNASGGSSQDSSWTTSSGGGTNESAATGGMNAADVTTTSDPTVSPDPTMGELGDDLASSSGDGQANCAYRPHGVRRGTGLIGFLLLFLGLAVRQHRRRLL